MKNFFLRVLNNIPLILLSFLLSFLIWVFATVSTDPSEEGKFSNSVVIETVGLADDMVINNSLPYTVSISMRAPESIWKRISLEKITAKAVIDVTGLEAGTYEVPIKIQMGISPVQVISYTPNTASVTLERVETRTYPVEVVENGEIPAAFKAETPVLSSDSVEITGTVSQLDTIDRVHVILDRANGTESVEQTLAVSAVTADGKIIKDLKVSPEKIKVSQEIKMRGGYRVLSVKLAVQGEISSGYRVDGISVDPGFVTVYSADKDLLNGLPGYVETDTIRLDHITESTNQKVALKVPDGITLVGDTAVTMNIAVSNVEGTSTITGIPIVAIGLDEGVNAVISPEDVDVVLSGPINILNNIHAQDIRAVIELQDLEPGSFQISPKIETASDESIRVQSVMPATIEVQIVDENAASLERENSDTE